MNKEKPTMKMGKDLNRHFTKTIHKWLISTDKKFLTQLVMREMQIKSLIVYPYIPIR